MGQLGELGHGSGQRGLYGVNLPRGAGRGHGTDHASFGDARGALAWLELEHGAGQRLRLAGLSAQHPVPAEGPHKPQCGIRVSPDDRPAQRRVQVVLLGGQLAQPAALLGATQPRVCRLGQVQVMGGEGVPDAVVLAGLGQPLQSVRAHGLQHPVPRVQIPVRVLASGDDRFIDQTGQRGEDVGRRQQVVGADPFGHGQRCAGREKSQPAGQRLLGGLKQVPAPVDHGPQRPVSGQRGPAAPGEQREPVVQPLGELTGGQRAQPHGGQLDGQRHPVQRAADPGHGGHVVRVQLEVRPDGHCPVTQQPDRRVGFGPSRPFDPGRRGRRGHRQRRDRAQGLAVDAQRLPAGGHDPHPRAGGQDPARERGGRLDDVLAVVEDYHVVAVSQRLGQPVQRTGPRMAAPARDDALADAEGVQDRVRHLGRLGDRRELHEPGPAREPPGHLGGQPRLAHSPRAGERDQAGRAEVLQHLGHLSIPADEAGQRARGHGGRGGAGGRHHAPFGIKGLIGGAGGSRGYGGHPLLAAQDAQVHLLELSRGVDAEPTGQQLAGLLVNL